MDPIDAYIESCKDILSSPSSNFTLDARTAGRDFINTWEQSRNAIKAANRIGAWPDLAKFLLFFIWLPLYIRAHRRADKLLTQTQEKQKYFKSLTH